MAHQGFHQVQKQTQTLVLAPQLRQSLKILQVAALELRNTILEELQTNPTLEEDSYEGMSVEQTTQPESMAENGDDYSNPQELQFAETFEVYRRMNEDNLHSMREENSNFQYSSEDAERRQHFFDSVQTEASLQEELMQQTRMMTRSPEIIRAMEFLVGSLNDHGFLQTSLSDIALLAKLPLQAMKDAHALLKTFDPPGIGASDVRESLLWQLELKGRGSSIAYEMISDHYALLLRRRIPDLARKLDVTQEDINEAIEEIAELDPAPGRQFSDDRNTVVTADVIVTRDDGGDWLISLNNDYIPRLRISPTYKALITKGELSRKEKEYLQDKLRSSKFLISSIAQRQQTIERITRELLHFQNDFFESGPSKLKPLTMSQIADVVGVHETTISRAIANKFIDTPHGLFEFRYFFTTGYQDLNGESIANTSIKERLAKIIEAENVAKPYSDQQIVEILAEEGIKIARRTVAKYREELGILPTNLRRQYS
jgi:RNA polymerase sigma-54 factor